MDISQVKCKPAFRRSGYARFRRHSCQKELSVYSECVVTRNRHDESVSVKFAFHGLTSLEV